MDKVHYKYAYYDATGKRKVKTFTASTITKAKQMAKDWDRKRPVYDVPKMTVSDCVDGYLTIKGGVLSPNTIRGYNNIKESHIDGGIGDIPLVDIKQPIVQHWITSLVQKGLAPKTVKNCFGLLQSAIKMYNPTIGMDIQLPMDARKVVKSPSDDDVKRIIEAIKTKGDRTLLIAVYLGAFGMMREAEICALESYDIRGNMVSINKALALTKDNEWVVKLPKTISSIRDVEVPQFVVDEMKGIEGRIVPLTPTALYNRYRKVISKLGMHYTFHQLRHYSCSVLHAIGISDLALTRMGGWSTDFTMKKVYRNIIDDEQKRQTKMITDHFEKVGG